MTYHKYSQDISTNPVANITLNNVGGGAGTVVQNPGTGNSFNIKSINSNLLQINNGTNTISIEPLPYTFLISQANDVYNTNINPQLITIGLNHYIGGYVNLVDVANNAFKATSAGMYKLDVCISYACPTTNIDYLGLRVTVNNTNPASMILAPYIKNTLGAEETIPIEGIFVSTMYIDLNNNDLVRLFIENPGMNTTLQGLNPFGITNYTFTQVQKT